MLAKLKCRLPGAQDDALLTALLSDAGAEICAYTQRDEVPDALTSTQVEIAILLYNRMGMEGESRHAEGSVSRSADSLPEFIRRQLNPYRRAMAVEA